VSSCASKERKSKGREAQIGRVASSQCAVRAKREREAERRRSRRERKERSQSLFFFAKERERKTEESTQSFLYSEKMVERGGEAEWSSL
jgi:hypothetical protein